VLRRAGFEVGFASTVASARNKIGQSPWNAVLVDLMLPDGSGADLLPEIHRFVLPSQVALVSAYVTADQVILSHREVAAIVPKPMGADSLVALVKILTQTDSVRNNVEYYATRCHLSQRESELLQLAVDGVDNKQAVERMRCLPGTIRSLWARILKKTGHRSQRDVIVDVLKLEAPSLMS